jgi:hypothetical protein
MRRRANLAAWRDSPSSRRGRVIAGQSAAGRSRAFRGWQVHAYNPVMNTGTHILNASVLSGLLVLGGAAAPPGSSASDDGFLRGPAVEDSAVRTLVNINMTGEFIRLPGRPEAAALAMVVIESERLERAREAITARSTALGMLLVDNIDLLRDATDAIKAGDEDAVREIYREMLDRFDPDRARDPLLIAFAEFVSPEELEDMTRLVDEYWEAWIRWELRNSPDRLEALREETEQRLSFSLFQMELGEAYNWSVRPFRERLERLYEITEASPEQRATIRDVVIDFIRETRLEPAPEQRRDATRAIHAVLDEEQRLRLFEHAVWQRQ